MVLPVESELVRCVKLKGYANKSTDTELWILSLWEVGRRKQDNQASITLLSHQQNVGILVWPGKLDNVCLRWPGQI